MPTKIGRWKLNKINQNTMLITPTRTTIDKN